MKTSLFLPKFQNITPYQLLWRKLPLSLSQPAQLYVQVITHFTGIRHWTFVFYISVIHHSLPVCWMHPEWVVSTFVCEKHCGTFLNTKQMFKLHHLVADISIQTTKHDTTKCINQCQMINSHVISLLPYCSVIPVSFRPRLLHSGVLPYVQVPTHKHKHTSNHI